MAGIWAASSPNFPYEGGMIVLGIGIGSATLGALCQWVLLRGGPWSLARRLAPGALGWAGGLSVIVLIPITFPVPVFGLREAAAGALCGILLYGMLVLGRPRGTPETRPTPTTSPTASPP